MQGAELGFEPKDLVLQLLPELNVYKLSSRVCFPALLPTSFWSSSPAPPPPLGHWLTQMVLVVPFSLLSSPPEE